jgi:hypothetical protein
VIMTLRWSFRFFEVGGYRNGAPTALWEWGGERRGDGQTRRRGDGTEMANGKWGFIIDH